jgi:uncharacterized membrane protein YeaQ/YmgE (transglycosylase-associated protein family)
MLPLLIWLATGVAVGLTVRALAPDRRHLGIIRACGLGAAGAALGGLLSVGLTPGHLLGSPMWAAWAAAFAGALLAPWGHMAFAVRWDPPQTHTGDTPPPPTVLAGWAPPGHVPGHLAAAGPVFRTDRRCG